MTSPTKTWANTNRSKELRLLGLAAIYHTSNRSVAWEIFHQVPVSSAIPHTSSMQPAKKGSPSKAATATSYRVGQIDEFLFATPFRIIFKYGGVRHHGDEERISGGMAREQLRPQHSMIASPRRTVLGAKLGKKYGPINRTSALASRSSLRFPFLHRNV